MSHGRSHKRKTKWGQNFLVNPGACARIIGALGDLEGRAVIEVGPGRGALTRLLVARNVQTVAVEIDPTLATELVEALGSEHLTLVEADATEADWPLLVTLALGAGAAPPVPFVGNLPYESGTAILQRWLAAAASDVRLGPAVVMLQLEVAERIGALPSTKAYGALAVMAQATHHVTSVMDVAPGSFRPAPSVWSRVIRLERLPVPLFAPDEREAHQAFLHAAFAHRRKQLAGAMAGIRGRAREDWQALLKQLGHPETARAEELSPAQLIELSRAAATAPGA